MYLTRFWFDLTECFIPAWTESKPEIGWRRPYFEFAAANTLVSLYNNVPPEGSRKAWYDSDADAFCFMPDSESQPECYKAETIEADGAALKVYAIGGRSWGWEDDSED